MEFVPGELFAMPAATQQMVEDSFVNVEQWIADLNSDQFPARERASKELEKLGRSAALFLRKAKENRPSPEQLRRIDVLLDKLVGIDLEQVQFPARVKIISPKELRARYLDGLKSDNNEIRGLAVDGLGELARFTDDVIPTMLETLKSDKHEYVRRSAASALARLGRRASAALPTAMRRLNGWRKASCARKAAPNSKSFRSTRSNFCATSTRRRSGSCNAI